MRKSVAMLLAMSMIGSILSGCSSGNSSDTTQTSGAETQVTTEAALEQSESVPAEKQVVEFWYCSANEDTNEIFEKLFDEYNASSDTYEFKYVGIANKDATDKLSMAIATETMPDVFSTGFYSVKQYVVQDAIIPVDEYFETWDNKDKFVPEVLESLRLIGDGVMYAFPYGYNQDISWYNKTFFDKEGIDVPQTQKEFLELCKKYANPDEGTYFFSLRGNQPYDNLLSWLFTYTDGGGYEGKYFDENNECIINKPEFVEALDAYADIYRNNWVSGDCVNNGFNEMVAEFGAGTAQYVMHNSSSRPNHESNLGAGNYGVSKSLSNDNGHYYNSALQSLLFAVSKKTGKGDDYTGAVELCKFLTSEKALSALCQNTNNIPVNSECYEADWFKNDDFMPLYQEILVDENHKSIENPYWLPEYNSFVQSYMTTDFQAVLMGEMTSQEALDHWAEILTEWQKEYAGQN